MTFPQQTSESSECTVTKKHGDDAIPFLSALATAEIHPGNKAIVDFDEAIQT